MKYRERERQRERERVRQTEREREREGGKSPRHVAFGLSPNGESMKMTHPVIAFWFFFFFFPLFGRLGSSGNLNMVSTQHNKVL